MLHPALGMALPRLPPHPCVPSGSQLLLSGGKHVLTPAGAVLIAGRAPTLARRSQVGHAERDLCQQAAALAEGRSRGLEVFWRFSEPVQLWTPALELGDPPCSGPRAAMLTGFRLFPWAQPGCLCCSRACASGALSASPSRTQPWCLWDPFGHGQ